MCACVYTYVSLVEDFFLIQRFPIVTKKSSKPGYYLFHYTDNFDVEKHVQNKISHLIILWTPSMPKLRGHKGFEPHDCHEAYNLIGKTCIFLFMYINMFLSPRVS